VHVLGNVVGTAAGELVVGENNVVEIRGLGRTRDASKAFGKAFGKAPCKAPGINVGRGRGEIHRGKRQVVKCKAALSGQQCRLAPEIADGAV
jgi:hypothetical protein